MRFSLPALVVAFCVALFACGEPALAQSNPGLVQGQVPSASQWNSYFSNKLDYAALTNNTVATGQWQFNNGVVVPPITAPVSPPNGLIYSTNAGFFGVVNGVPVQFGGGSSPATAPLLLSSQIPNFVVGPNTSIVVSGFAATGDSGVGAVFTSIGASSGGPMAVQDLNGTWFNLVTALYPQLANNAAIGAASRVTFPIFMRQAYATPGDAPPIAYVPQAGSCNNAGAGDGGSQVPMADGCAIAIFPSPNIDVREFGAKGNSTFYYYCAMASSSAVLGCDGTFTAAQATAHQPIAVNGAGTAGGTLITTINSVQGASFTGVIGPSSTTLTVSGVTGTIAIGEAVLGTGVALGTHITGGSGSTWTVSISQSVTSRAMTSNAATLAAVASTALTGVFWQGALAGADDTAAINADMMANLSGGRCVFMPPGVYYVTAAINPVSGVRICAAGSGSQELDVTYPSLYFVGASGHLLPIPATVSGFGVDGVNLKCFDVDYQDHLVTLGVTGTPTSQILFRNMEIGCGIQVLKGTSASITDGTQAGPALSGVEVLGAYGVTFDNVVFNNTQVAVQGPLTSDANANGFTFLHPFFQGGFAKAPVQFSGQGWAFLNPIVEPYNDGYVAAGSRACGFIADAATSSVTIGAGLTVSGGTIEDAATGNGTCIDTSLTASGSATGLTNGTSITGVDFESGGTAIRLGSGVGDLVSGNYIDGFTTGLDIDTTNASQGATGNFCGNGYISDTTNQVMTAAVAPSCVDTINVKVDVEASTLSLGAAPIKYGLITNASFTGTISSTTLTVSGVTGTIVAGQAVAGTGVKAGTVIVSGSGTTWTVNVSQSVGPVAMTGAGATSLPGAHLYSYPYYLEVTAANGSGTVTPTLQWVDETGNSETCVGAALSGAAQGYESGTCVIYADGTHNVNYSVTVSSGTPTYTYRASLRQDGSP